ncbi:hypothetical protein P43SY_005696 [Pythium insidiosum]|uniref:Uncharacterized protein n=1 Tax=Pythium insidiosum TaxID=114742 RepID=A0AAD5QAM2_PYTIN|nr:hypothetical protein P43SY_005696 [Pythium insidiosum]
MGCCSSKAAKRYDDDDAAEAVISHGVVHGSTAAMKSKSGRAAADVREPTLSEKRRNAAAAAEARQADWRQGGAADPEKAKALRERREKDELLGRIYNRYNVLGKEPPIGLPSCDVDQLKRHLATLK